MEPESLLPHSQVTIIPLKEKTTAAKYSYCYVINLIAHTAKIVARILRRTERKIEDVLGGDQFGVIRRKGNRDATRC
jgi:hypothetical protein